MRACWAVQGEEAPGRVFLQSGVCSFPVLRFFACLSGFFWSFRTWFVCGQEKDTSLNDDKRKRYESES